MSDILAQLEEAEWTAPQKGREATPSPYLPAVQKSAEGGFDATTKLGKAFSLTINVGTGNKDEQDKALASHVNLLRKAGRQMDPPCSVLVQAGDIARGGKNKGDVKITFVAREKIVRQASGEQSAA